jgi:hypothetical protein
MIEIETSIIKGRQRNGIYTARSQY